MQDSQNIPQEQIRHGSFCPDHFFRCSGGDNLPPLPITLGAKVDNIIGKLDDTQVVVTEALEDVLYSV
jgi:hypothetical protein